MGLSKRLTPIYGQAPCFPSISFITGGACSGLDPYAGPHIHTVKLVRGILIVTSILETSAGASSSSSSGATLDQDSADDYPKIREVPVGTPPRRAASSSWWPRLEGLHRTDPADIPPSED
jgi:hypothetical protein